MLRSIKPQILRFRDILLGRCVEMPRVLNCIKSRPDTPWAPVRKQACIWQAVPSVPIYSGPEVGESLELEGCQGSGATHIALEMMLRCAQLVSADGSVVQGVVEDFPGRLSPFKLRAGGGWRGGGGARWRSQGFLEKRAFLKLGRFWA